MNILRITKNHKNAFLNFLLSLDKESLTTYTRWRSDFEPEKIAEQVVEDNISGKEIGYVSIIGEKIVGYTHLNFKPRYRKDVVTEGSLVMKSYSGRGIGSALKKKCIETAFQEKIYKFVAWVHENNWISLHNAMNNDFLVAGIYLNEEKINFKPNYLVYFERPIMLKANQDDYVNALKKYADYFNSGDAKKKIKLEKDTLRTLTISKLDVKSNLKDKNLFELFSKENSSFKIQILNEFQKNISSIICITRENYDPICYGYLEFFDLKEKSHVARIQVKNIKEIKLQKSYHLFFQELIKIAKNRKLEKIWTNVPEINSILIDILIGLGFIVEGIAFGEILIGKKSVNSLSLAYHFKEKNRPNYIIQLIEKIINA